MPSIPARAGGVPVAIACPNCDHRLQLKAAKPGRYRPRCPACHEAFALSVPAQSGAAFEVLALPSGSLAQTPLPRGSAGSHVLALARTAPDLRSPSVAHSPDPPPTPDTEEDDEFVAPRTEVRGYKIEKELGRGGMGAVYLARQLSLDRHVALKVMAKRWACDPTFVARFTREAYAAAQLSHPNIVHIHDIGEVDGARFFCMEYVPGRSLADVVRANGKLDPETAVGYVLQAARGLKHAHDRGMIHRDVKPDNLLLDDQGLVKVADLGLVKTPTTSRADDAVAGPTSGLGSLPADVTGAGIALGTPTYMSPEQCRDAAAVDLRADIYSLGCTLYVLVTGRPPFDGTTAVELMTKHAYEPLPPPERLVARLPAEVAAVIKRMTAKAADDRFQSMGEVVRTLEAWLGVHHAGTFSPQEEQIAKLEGYVAAFNAAPAARLRRRAVAAFFGGTGLLAVLLLFFGKFGWACGLVGLMVQAAAAYLVLNGVARHGHLFGRVRQFAGGLAWADRGIAAAGVALFALLLWMSGVFWLWAGFGLVGVGLAFALHYRVSCKADEQRQAPLRACESLLRRLRVRGLDEAEVRLFVARFAGRHWEEFYEALFGFEAKLAARALLSRGGTAGPRETFAAWREPLLTAIDRAVTARKAARDRKLLRAVEQARLEAEGLARADAAGRAAAQADRMVRQADHMRRAEFQRVRFGPTGHAAMPVVATGPNADFAFAPEPANRFGWVVGLFVGPHVRAVAAAVLLAACAVWAHQNGMVSGAEVTAAAGTKDLAGVEQALRSTAGRATKPLAVEGVPPHLTAWADGFNVGAAGLLLLGSLCFRGNLMALGVVLGAGVAVAGHHLGIRTVEPFQAHHVALAVGSVLCLCAYRTGSR